MHVAGGPSRARAGAALRRAVAAGVALALLAAASHGLAFIATGRPWPKRLRGTVVYTGDCEEWVSPDGIAQIDDHYTVEFHLTYRITGVTRLTATKKAATYALETMTYEVTDGSWYSVEWDFDRQCYGEQDGVYSGEGSSLDPALGGVLLFPAVRAGGTRFPRASTVFAMTPPGALTLHIVDVDHCDGGGGAYDRTWGVAWTRTGRYLVRGTTLKVRLDRTWFEPGEPVPGMPTYIRTLTGTLKGLCRGACP